MKKLAAVMLVVAAVLSVSCAFADDGEKMIVDDVNLDKEYKIKRYAAVKFDEVGFTDSVIGINTTSFNYSVDSGTEADFVYIRFDMRNLAKKAANLLRTMTVKVIYDDEYEYYGFAVQYDYERSTKFYARYDMPPIASLYTGHFGLFCAVPNAVVADTESPLRMIITINGHEFTYNIRK